MRQHLRFFKGFAELDLQIEKFRQLRNDYAEANKPRHVATFPELAPFTQATA